MSNRFIEYVRETKEGDEDVEYSLKLYVDYDYDYLDMDCPFKMVARPGARVPLFVPADQQLEMYPDEFEEYLLNLRRDRVPYEVIEVYLYDHSGYRVSTHDFHDPWDSGHVGYLWVEKPEWVKYWGKKRFNHKEARKALVNWIEYLDQIFIGDVYGYTLEKTNYRPDGYFKEEELDSCWGFVGREYFSEEIHEILKYHKLPTYGWELHGEGYLDMLDLTGNEVKAA